MEHARKGGHLIKPSKPVQMQAHVFVLYQSLKVTVQPAQDVNSITNEFGQVPKVEKNRLSFRGVVEKGTRATGVLVLMLSTTINSTFRCVSAYHVCIIKLIHITLS